MKFNYILNCIQLSDYLVFPKEEYKLEKKTKKIVIFYHNKLYLFSVNTGLIWWQVFIITIPEDNVSCTFEILKKHSAEKRPLKFYMWTMWHTLSRLVK